MKGDKRARIDRIGVGLEQTAPSGMKLSSTAVEIKRVALSPTARTAGRGETVLTDRCIGRSTCKLEGGLAAELPEIYCAFRFPYCLPTFDFFFLSAGKLCRTFLRLPFALGFLLRFFLFYAELMLPYKNSDEKSRREEKQIIVRRAI